MKNTDKNRKKINNKILKIDHYKTKEKDEYTMANDEYFDLEPARVLHIDQEKLEKQNLNKNTIKWQNFIANSHEIQGITDVQKKNKAEKIEKEMKKWTLKIKKFAEVLGLNYKDQIKKASKNAQYILGDNYDFYVVKTGLQILVPGDKLKEIRFKLTIASEDGKIGDLIILDGFPTDVIKKSKIASGSIDLNLDDGLKIIPMIGDVLSGILDIKIKYEFDWSKKNLEVRFSEAGSDEVDWHVESEEIKSFECHFTLKKKKTIKNPYIIIKALYRINPAGWFNDDIWLESDPKKVDLDLST